MDNTYTKRDYQIARAEIREYFLGMTEGWVTARLLCPLCRGGSERERSLSAAGTSEGGVFFCFRAACGFKGQVGVRGFTPPVPHFEPRPFVGETVFLDGPRASALGLTYGEAAAARVRAVVGDPKTVVYECRGLDGTLLGDVTRSDQKKIRTYRLEPDIYYSHPVLFSPSLWIVEDALSAAHLGTLWHRFDGPLVSSVALLGTHMTEKLQRDIVAYVTRYSMPVYVALDAGAERQAKKVLERLADEGLVCNYVRLDKDIKNLTWAEKAALVRQYANRE